MIALIALVAASMQAAAGPPAPVPPRASSPPPSSCSPASDPEDVVVCAGDPTRFRLKPLPARAARPVLPKAEVGVLGKARVAAEAEAATVGGFPSNRAMLRVKMPF